MGLRTNLPPNQPDADDERNKVGVNPPNQQAMQQVQPQGVQSSPKPTTQQPSASAQPQSPQLTPGAGLQPRPGTGPTQAKGTGFVGARQYAQAGSGGQQLAQAVAGRISGAASGGAEQLQKAREQFQSGIGQVQQQTQAQRDVLAKMSRGEQLTEAEQAGLQSAYTGLQYSGPQGLSSEEAQDAASRAASLAGLTETAGGRATLLGGVAGRRASGYGAGLRALDVGLLGQAGVTPELAKARSEALGLGGQIVREQEAARQQAELAKGGLSKLKEDVKSGVATAESAIEQAYGAGSDATKAAEQQFSTATQAVKDLTEKNEIKIPSSEPGKTETVKVFGKGLTISDSDFNNLEKAGLITSEQKEQFKNYQTKIGETAKSRAEQDYYRSGGVGAIADDLDKDVLGRYFKGADITKAKDLNEFARQAGFKDLNEFKNIMTGWNAGPEILQTIDALESRQTGTIDRSAKKLMKDSKNELENLIKGSIGVESKGFEASTGKLKKDALLNAEQRARKRALMKIKGETYQEPGEQYQEARTRSALSQKQLDDFLSKYSPYQGIRI